jgi:hypothetical protein
MSETFVQRLDQFTQALLSLYIVWVCGINKWQISRKSSNWANSSRNFTHSLVAYISASAELLAVMDWRFDIQWSGPKRSIK